jgi:hypothetical protein
MNKILVAFFIFLMLCAVASASTDSQTWELTVTATATDIVSQMWTLSVYFTPDAGVDYIGLQKTLVWNGNGWDEHFENSTETHEIVTGVEVMP